MYKEIIMNTSPTEKCIGWTNTRDKWKTIDNIFGKDLTVMKCKLWRSSYERNGVTFNEQQDKLKHIEINSLDDLIQLINNENCMIKISPKDQDEEYWVEVEDYFND